MPILPHKVTLRLAIYPKDIQNITGRKGRAARKLLADIREKLNKNSGDFVTVQEFCQHTGFKEDQVRPFLL